MWDLLWHDRRASDSVTSSDSWNAIVRDLSAHLLAWARLGGKAELQVPAPVTIRSALAALQARHPILRGTTRDPGTLRRRAHLHAVACLGHFSLELPDRPLPEVLDEARGSLPAVVSVAGG